MKIVVVRKTRVAVSKAAGTGSSPVISAILKKLTKRGKNMERAGFCPVCGSEDLNYEDQEFYGDLFLYEWNCPNCEAFGIENYKLTFIGHTVNFDPTRDADDAVDVYTEDADDIDADDLVDID